MSRVTNVVLLMSCGELDDSDEKMDRFPALEALNAWLRKTHGPDGEGGLHEVSQYGGNSKAMECYIAIGAFNYLDVEAFIAAVVQADWVDPDNVQLLIQEQEEDTFREYRVIRKSPIF